MKRKEQKFRAELERNYFLFVQFLYENNYEIVCENDEEGLETCIKGNGIKGFLWLDKNYMFRANSGIAVDNVKCWDKISKCPFRMKIPKPSKFNVYLRRILFWGTRKGFEFSNNYDRSQYNHDGT